MYIGRINNFNLIHKYKFIHESNLFDRKQECRINSKCWNLMKQFFIEKLAYFCSNCT